MRLNRASHMSKNGKKDKEKAEISVVYKFNLILMALPIPRTGSFLEIGFGQLIFAKTMRL